MWASMKLRPRITVLIFSPVCVQVNMILSSCTRIERQLTYLATQGSTLISRVQRLKTAWDSSRRMLAEEHGRQLGTSSSSLNTAIATLKTRLTTIFGSAIASHCETGMKQGVTLLNTTAAGFIDILTFELTTMISQSGIANTVSVKASITSLQAYAKQTLSVRLSTLASETTLFMIAAADSLYDYMLTLTPSLPPSVSKAIVLADKVFTAADRVQQLQITAMGAIVTAENITASAMIIYQQVRIALLCEGERLVLPDKLDRHRAFVNLADCAGCR